jgi:hypothetical protein
MERHNAIIENVHAVAEKEHQRQEKEQDLDSNSGLSVLASSLFNGIEGIESGRALSVK